ncbi:MAG: hypothetical protein ACTSO7_01270 [Candidatus Heimdallarchaeota archaeon]
MSKSKKTSKTTKSPPKTKESLEEPPKKPKSKSMKQKLLATPRFFVRQLYRMQYGYTKLNVFIQLINTVSLLLILFNAADFFEIEWWHILTIYIGLIAVLLATVYIFELFGAWHTEQKQIFKMTTGEIWREQMELRSLLFAKYVRLSDEEIEQKIDAVSRRLFPDKYTK